MSNQLDVDQEGSRMPTSLASMVVLTAPHIRQSVNVLLWFWHEPEEFGGAAIPSAIGGATDAPGAIASLAGWCTDFCWAASGIETATEDGVFPYSPLCAGIERRSTERLAVPGKTVMAWTMSQR